MDTNGVRVLAIDDSQDDLTLLKRTVSANLPGATLLTALDGPGGIKLALAEDPDVILLDIVLPGMDGFEICRTLKRDERLAHIPVVFMTAARTDTKVRVKALEAGAEGFLAKPVEEAELLAQVRAMAKVKAAHRLQQHHEEQLSSLVAERTRELEEELARRKSAEEEALESSELFKGSVESMLDCFGVYSAIRDQSNQIADFRIEYVNAAACANNLMTRDEQVGRRLCELLPSHRQTGLFDEYCDVVETGRALRKESIAYEDSYRGRQISRAFDISAVKVGDGFAASWRDITERKRTEEELRRVRELLDETQALTKVGGWEFDVTANKLTWTDEVYRIYGVGPDYDPNDVASDISFYAPGSAETIEAAFKRAVEDGEPYDLELGFIRTGGERIWVRTMGRPVLEGGRVVRVHGNLVDITERRRAEEARLELERQLLHSQKLESLGVLAGGIAHDFNNLLQVVLGNVEMAKTGMAPEDSARLDLDEAIRATNRAADLTRQMLAYAGKGQFVIEEVHLNDLVLEHTSMLRTAIHRTVDLRIHLEPGLPPVLADAAQVQQVLMNLLTNASESIVEAPGTVTLRTGAMACDADYLNGSRLEEKPKPGQFAWLEVTDDGCGMDGKTQKRLFEPFYTTKFTGRGLGLSAVMGIVRALHGALMLKSELGSGTTVRVLFPVTRHEGAEVAEGQAPSPGVGASSVPSLGTVLVVDDATTIRGFCVKVLRSQGFEVLTARDGEEAVTLFRTHSERIVCTLLDLTMPRMSGLPTFHEIRRIKPDAKVVLCSGYDEEKATESFKGQGLAGFLQKPYTLDALRATLGEVLSTVQPADSCLCVADGHPVKPSLLPPL